MKYWKRIEEKRKEEIGASFLLISISLPFGIVYIDGVLEGLYLYNTSWDSFGLEWVLNWSLIGFLLFFGVGISQLMGKSERPLQIVTAMVSALVFLNLAQGCFGENENDSKVASADFTTMAECVMFTKRAAERASGSSFKYYIVDTPSQVSGELANGKTFTCGLRKSGTRGVYYNGWYID